jgi:hypothetical protein
MAKSGRVKVIKINAVHLLFQKLLKFSFDLSVSNKAIRD